MRVTMVLPFPFWTGGVRAVYEHSRRLRARGHVVRVVFPLTPYWFRIGGGTWPSARAWIGAWRKNLMHGAHPPGVPVAWDLERVPMIADAFLPDADVVMATAWPTAYSVHRLSPRKGVKAYLVQHRELDSGRPEDVDGTFRLGLFLIAGSRSTARLLQAELGVQANAIALNGVDLEFWGARMAAPPPRSGVLMLYAGGEHKGGADGLAALTELRRARPATRIRAFGQPRRSALPEFIEYIERPADKVLRDLYATSEVFLYSSRFEGFGLPPLEAQAAGCAVVSTRVGDVPEFLSDGENGVLVEPGDTAAMSAAMLALLKQPERRERLARAGAASAALHGWDQEAEALERAFERAVAGSKEPAGSARAQG